MHYMVNHRVFGTLQEAKAYADDYFGKTGVILAVTATNRKVTHIYNAQ